MTGRQKPPLAQWSEQRPFKSWVVGSNPTGGTAAVDGTAGNREWNPVTRRWTGNQKRPRGTRVKHHRTDGKAAIPQGRRVPEVRCARLRSGGRLRASSRGGGIRPRSSAERAPPPGGGRRRFESGRGHVGTHDIPWKTEECWSIPAAVAHARRRKTHTPGGGRRPARNAERSSCPGRESRVWNQGGRCENQA